MTEQRNKLKVGLIGLGKISKDRHLPFYLKNKDVDLVGVCDINPEKFKDLDILGFTDYKDLLKQGLDVVDIATPPFDHVEQCLDCLKEGCNIIVEKPFTFTLKGCDKILDFALKIGKKVCVFHSSLFFPVLMDAKKNLGCLGDIKLVRLKYNISKANHVLCNDWILKMPYGALDEQIPHVAYIFNEFMRPDVAKVISDSRRNNYLIILEDHSNDISGSIDLHYGDDWVFQLEIIGSEKKAFIDILNQNFSIMDLKEDISKRSIFRDNISPLKNSLKSLFKIMGYSSKPYGHEYIINEFVNSIINGSDPPVSFMDIREVVRITSLITKCVKQDMS